MYTRCPSCRAEISFEPPADLDRLPEGYKHRIKCPNCGVTIGVRIPRPESTATVQPTYYPQNLNATSFQPVYQTAPMAAGTAEPETKKALKKPGTGRNVFMMIVSLLFVGLALVAYFADKIPFGDMTWLKSQFTQFFGGITYIELLITDFTAFKTVFQSMEPLAAVISLVLPMVLFVFPGIMFVVDFIAACAKKYSRAFNFIFCLIIDACAVFVLFIPMVASKIAIGQYFTETLIPQQLYLLIAVAALGLIQFICALAFCKSLKIKDNRD